MKNIGQIKELAFGWKLSRERAAAKTLIDRNDWVFVYLKSGFMLPGTLTANLSDNLHKGKNQFVYLLTSFFHFCEMCFK